MPDYEKLYHLLFNAITDALSALEKGRTDSARLLLICAQQTAEARYLDT
ncbi:MAG: hypothetical protein IJJ99_09755 [Oscillospiraceae bacterium]|nr:hypothetical protein [Oscillospiraceae bacterium]